MRKAAFSGRLFDGPNCDGLHNILRWAVLSKERAQGAPSAADLTLATCYLLLGE